MWGWEVTTFSCWNFVFEEPCSVPTSSSDNELTFAIGYEFSDSADKKMGVLQLLDLQDGAHDVFRYLPTLGGRQIFLSWLLLGILNFLSQAMFTFENWSGNFYGGALLLLNPTPASSLWSTALYYNSPSHLVSPLTVRFPFSGSFQTSGFAARFADFKPDTCQTLVAPIVTGPTSLEEEGRVVIQFVQLLSRDDTTVRQKLKLLDANITCEPGLALLTTHILMPAPLGS